MEMPTITLYDAMCECGHHTQTLEEPVCCNRCGSNRFTIDRFQAHVGIDLGDPRVDRTATMHHPEQGDL
jgi:hypothetical protein